MQFSFDELATLLALVDAEKDSVKRSLERPLNRRGRTHERLARYNWQLISMRDKIAAEMDRGLEAA